MALPTLVQHRHTGSNEGTAANATEGRANTFKINLPNASLSGNCIVLMMTYEFSAGRTYSITDNKSNTWPTTPTVTNHDTTRSVAIFVLPNAIAGTQTITVAFDAGVFMFQTTISEFYNVATTSAVNGTTSAAVAAGPTVAAGSFTPTLNNDANGGNLILQYATDTIDFPNNGTPTGAIAPGTNFSLLSADWHLSVATQYWVQATSAAVNPTLTMTGVTDTFLTAAVALRAAAAGTAPAPGLRVITQITHFFSALAVPGSQKVQLPSAGNLLVLHNTYIRTPTTFSAVTDNHTNTWTQVSTPIDRPNMWYAQNPTTANDLLITVTINPGGTTQIILYDITGAATTGVLDVEADAAGTLTANGVFTGLSMTPTTAGIIIAAIDVGQGPFTNMSGAPQFFMVMTYPTMNSDSQDGSGDGFGMRYIGPGEVNTSISIGWDMEQNPNLFPASTSWQMLAVAFKAAPVQELPLMAGRAVLVAP